MKFIALRFILLAILVYPHPLRSQCGRGVYSLTGAGRPVASGVLSNPNVDGVSIRLHWNDLETADGVYDWTYLDTQISRVVAAGKSVSLRIGTGGGDATRGNGGSVPGWVIDEITASVGGTPNDCTHYFHFNNPPVADQAIPTFWEPIFVQKRRELLTALGAHFAGNTNIKVVFVGACNAKSSDWSVPDSAVVDNICGPGQSERSRLLGLGYTSQKLIDQACPATGRGGVIDAAALAFPDKFIAYAVGRNSGLDPTPDYVAEHITQNARAKYGNRILIAKESLSQKTFEDDPYNQQPANNSWTILWELPPCAAQMASDVTSANGLARMSGQRDGGPVQVLTDAVNVGADYGTVYQEIYQDDVTNPVTAPVIAYAHGLLACPPPQPTPTPSAGTAMVADFNGDGHPDLVVQNAATHQTVIGYLNNNVVVGAAYGPTLPGGWKLKAVADFNRDSHPDYALFIPVTGQTIIGYLSGPTVIGAALGPALPGGWELVAAADFNGDGYPDYVLYVPSTHQTVIGYLNNNVVVGAALGPPLPAGWNLMAVADFDRDGNPDYALFNPATGQTLIGYLSGPTVIGAAFGPTLSGGWQLVAAADFNGDGGPDYLLYKPSTRQTTIWYLNNNVYVRAAFGPTLPAGWSLVGP